MRLWPLVVPAAVAGKRRSRWRRLGGEARQLWRGATATRLRRRDEPAGRGRLLVAAPAGGGVAADSDEKEDEDA